MSIARKKKKCKNCGREDYSWSKGMCKGCASLSGKQKKVNQNSKTKTINDDFGFMSQKEMFSYIWDNLPLIDGHKRCWISDAPLMPEGHYLFYNQFAHVLPKGKYPLFKLNPENIVVILPEIHYLYDMGTEEQRMNSGYNFNKLYDLKVKMFIEYNNHLKNK
jgi:hypothetical protein